MVVHNAFYNLFDKIFILLITSSISCMFSPMIYSGRVKECCETIVHTINVLNRIRQDDTHDSVSQ